MQVRWVQVIAVGLSALIAAPTWAADKSVLAGGTALAINGSGRVPLNTAVPINFLNDTAGQRKVTMRLAQPFLCADLQTAVPTENRVAFVYKDPNNEDVGPLFNGITSYDYFTNGAQPSLFRVVADANMACCLMLPDPGAFCIQGTKLSATVDVFASGFETPASPVDLEVKVVGPDNVSPVGIFSYKITVSNRGTAQVSGVRVRDWFPKAGGGVAFQSGAWTCQPELSCGVGGASSVPADNGNIKENGITLDAGASVTYTVARPLSVGALGSTFSVSAAAFAPPAAGSPVSSAEADLGNNQGALIATVNRIGYSLAPSTLTFNSVVGQSDTKILRVTAPSDNSATLVVQGCSFSGQDGPQFDIPMGLPVSVVANATTEISVRFSPGPGNPSPRSAVMTCQTNATTIAADFVVSLAGTVVPANDPPEIDPIANQSSNEDAVDLVFQISARDDDSVLAATNLSCSSSRPNLDDRSTCTFTGSEPNFMLMLSPAPDRNSNVPFGTETITVTVNDNEGAPNSIATRSFVFDVAPVNDAPVFTLSQSDIQVPAGTSGIVQVTSFVTGIGPGPDTADDEQQQLLQQFPPMVAQGAPAGFFASPPVITYSGDPEVGNLAFLLGPDAVGVAEVSVRMKDNGGTANGGVDERVRTFTITALPPPPPTGPSLSYAPRPGTETVPGTVRFTGGASGTGTITVTPSGGTTGGTSTLHTFVQPGGDAAFFALTSDPTLTFPSQGTNPQDVTLTCNAGATVRRALLQATETVQGSTPVQLYWELECPPVVSGAD